MALGLNLVRLAFVATFLDFLYPVNAHASQVLNLTLGPSTYRGSGVFPTSVFSSYYNNPTATTAQPQPVISDPVTGVIYPFNLTNPKTLPTNDSSDPHPLPPKATPTELLAQAVTLLEDLYNSSAFANISCERCLASLAIGKMLTLTAPEQVPAYALEQCVLSGSGYCSEDDRIDTLGNIIAQVYSVMDPFTDGMAYCNEFLKACPAPTAQPLNLTGWFAKPKPNPLPPPKVSNGERLKVLHLSDIHLDPRYATGSEANCTNDLCCREGNPNVDSPNQTLLPAPQFGAFWCDSPLSLVGAALEAIEVLVGGGINMTVFTGDLVSHDPYYQLSRSYVEYVEALLYGLFKETLGSGPVYAALGNHEGSPEAQDVPGSLFPQGYLNEQMSWNYEHLSALWALNGYIDIPTAFEANIHNGAYSVSRSDGLRIITLNTDLWYKSNVFMYASMENPDRSGMLRFLTDELQAAEDAGERAWIIGHVLSGWDGSNPLIGPTDLFYQIVDRYSPHVIASIFFGHTHEDQFMIYYANNGTNMTSGTAGAVGWIAPSITPLTNLNSGFRLYDVDKVTFEILDAHTWYSNVSKFATLEESGPTYEYEYSTREAYGANISWPASAPLNATWWHLATEQFEANPSLVQTFTQHQGKMSDLTPNCTNSDCVEAKICYMRSGSAAIAQQKCKYGYGSVQ